jgi:hypothetical protein
MTSPTGAARYDGALARLARACALHSGRTIGTWVMAIAVLFISANAFGGQLVNTFTIPARRPRARSTCSRRTSPSGPAMLPRSSSRPTAR